MKPTSYTRSQRQRLIDDWQRIADEGGLFEFFDDGISFYGSELATLRLFRYYAHRNIIDRICQGYSENLGTHYFSLDILY